jgi:hypothetical protein
MDQRTLYLASRWLTSVLKSGEQDAGDFGMGDVPALTMP